MAEATTTPTTTTEDAAAAAAAAATAAAGTNGTAAPDGTATDGGLLGGGLKATEAVSAAPEKYEAFTMPEGMTADPKMVEAFSPVFKDAGLSQAGAQKIVDAYIANQNAQQAAHSNVGEAWRESVQNDPLIGGADHNAKLGVIARAIDGYLSKHKDPELEQFRSDPVWQNHPGVARLVYYLANKGAEATAAGTMGGGAGKPTEAERLAAQYPTMKGN
jgi:hypothetical protein